MFMNGVIQRAGWMKAKQQSAATGRRRLCANTQTRTWRGGDHAPTGRFTADSPALKGFTMTEKSASVLWTGSGREGKGQISTESGALMDYPCGFASRFGDERRGSNPEELLAAAHAACFTMAFSFACAKAGVATNTVDTQAHVRLTAQGEGYVIDRIALKLTASVPGVDDAHFQQLAAAAKRDCPLSKALASVHEITLEATLNLPVRSPDNHPTPSTLQGHP
jgi:lipoyl-dependent peroxiredoxin